MKTKLIELMDNNDRRHFINTDYVTLIQEKEQRDCNGNVVYRSIVHVVGNSGYGTQLIYCIETSLEVNTYLNNL